MLKVFVILYFVTVPVKCEYVRKRRDLDREGRFFSFNTVDDDIQISLDFSIPFISIPVKKTMNSVHGFLDLPTININPASLALGGAVVLGTTIVIPFLLKNYAHESNERYARILDNAEFGADAMLDLAQQMMGGTHGFRGCPLRVACWAAQQDNVNPRVILHQIVSNKLLSAMVNSSAVEDAMISGRYGRSCSSFGPCPLQEHHIPLLMKNLAIFANGPGYS